MTADGLLALPNAKDFELVDGDLVGRHSAFQDCHIAGQLAAQLFLFNQNHRTGWVQGPGCGYRLSLPGRINHTVRKPDVSFVSFHRLPVTPTWPTGYPEVAPDLAVDVVAPGDLEYQIEAKLNDYLLAGVRLVWIIYPPTGSVRVFRHNSTSARLMDTDDLDGEDVIPGFRCSIASLLQLPQP